MSVPQVLISARDHLLSKGIPLSGAIASASVLYRESKLHPGSQGVQGTEHGGIRNPQGAYGIASWNGPRQQDYTTFCDAHHLIYDDLINQLDFFLNEMANHYPASWAAIRSEADYESIISVLVDEYENPKDKPTETHDAIIIAKTLAQVPLSASTVPKPAPTPAPAVPVPQIPTSPSKSSPTAPLGSSADIHHTNFQENVRRYRDFLVAERDAVVVEFNTEITALDTLIASPSTSLPPALEATTQGTSVVPAILTHILTNWLTSSAGTIAGGPAILDILQHGGVADWAHDIPQLATMVVGWLAPDPKTVAK